MQLGRCNVRKFVTGDASVVMIWAPSIPATALHGVAALSLFGCQNACNHVNYAKRFDPLRPNPLWIIMS